MELRHLRAFREVARQQSFSQAAARLGYVQSTVSAQVQGLERDLGVRLFDRLGRSVALTDAGRALLPFADRLLEVADEAVDAVARQNGSLDGPAGTITISAPESLLTYRLPAVLSRFRRAAPGVTVELMPTPVGRLRGVTRHAIATGAVDLAFVLDTPVRVAGFRAMTLIEEEVSIIAAADHRLAAAEAVRPGDLGGEALLMPEAPDSGCVYRAQFERQLADDQISPTSSLEFASIETVKQCVVAGMGIAPMLSVAVASDVSAGHLVRLRWTGRFEVSTQIVWSERRSLSPAMRAFIEIATRTFDDDGGSAAVPPAVDDEVDAVHRRVLQEEHARVDDLGHRGEPPDRRLG